MKVYVLETGIITTRGYLWDEERCYGLDLDFLKNHAEKDLSYNAPNQYYCIFEEDVSDDTKLNDWTIEYTTRKPDIKNWLYFIYTNRKGRVKYDRRRFSKKY